MTDISPSGGRGKPRITLRRDYRNGKPLPLRRTPFVVQIGVTRRPTAALSSRSVARRPLSSANSYCGAGRHSGGGSKQYSAVASPP